MRLLAVALAGACGAPVRLLVERAMARRFGHGFPWGTLAVNVVGAFTAGALSAMSSETISGTSRTAVSAGLLGAFTTFSTFTNETMRLAESSQPSRAPVYVTLTVLGALAGAGLGVALGG